MKKRLLYTIVVVSLLHIRALDVLAQESDKIDSLVNRLHDESLVRVNQFEQHGADLNISFSLDLNSVDIRSKQKLIYTPVLTGVANRIELPVISLQGKNNHNTASRKLHLMGRKARLALDVQPLPYASFKSYKDGDKVVNYLYTLPYEDWMGDVKLELMSDLVCRCSDVCEHNVNVLVDLAKLEITPITVTLKESADIATIDSVVVKIIRSNPFVAHLSGYEEDIKILGTRKDKDALKFYFELSKVSLDKDLMTNKDAINSVVAATQEINNTNELNIAKILIAGFASVEGTYDFNSKLSIGRAKSISDYLKANTNIDTTLVAIFNGGEDWAGLRELVAASNMEYKSEVLHIIDNTPIRTYEGRKLVDGRNHQLMNLRHGAPYRYMQKHFLPKLRQAGYIRIYYDIKKDSVAQKINLAMEDIDAKLYDKALASLLEVSDDERSDIALGVCYMMMGDFDRAKEYLQKAADRGDTNAQKNLDQILRRTNN